MKLKQLFIKQSLLLIIVLLLFFGLLITQSCLLFPGYLIIKILFSAFFTISFISCIYYLLFDNKYSTGKLLLGFHENKIYYGIIILVLIFIYLPFFTEGYYYYDDYWGYPGEHLINGINIGLHMMRPFHGLLSEMFWFVTPSTGYIIKWFSMTMTILYALILYKWIEDKSGDKKTALLISLALSVFSPLSDHIGYSSTITMMPGMLVAGLSVISFDKGYRKRKSKSFLSILYFTISFICLLFSFMLYQVATPIVFLFLAIYVFYNANEKSSIKFVFIFLVYFSLISVSYLLFNKWLNRFYNISTWSRGGFMDIFDILPKIKWFFFTVIPAVFDRLSAAFFGKLIVKEKNYWYFLSFFNPQIKIFIYGVFLFTTTFGTLLFFIRRKKILDVILLLSFIPMSYYCFLILKESGYLTYYAIPILSLFLLYAVFSLAEILNLKRLFNKININNFLFYAILSFLVVVLAFQNNTYIRQFWVGENKEGYNFLKNTLSIQIHEKKEIHVFGVLTPGQGNVYSEFATKMAIKELGYTINNYKITVSDDEKLISIIQSDKWDEIAKKTTLQERNTLLSYYTYDKSYSRYIYSAGVIASDKSQELTEIFRKCGLLPDNYNKTAIVDLRWICPYWQEARNATQSNVRSNILKSKIDSVINCPHDVLGNIDLVNYVNKLDILEIFGWAAIDNVNSINSRIKVYLGIKHK